MKNFNALLCGFGLLVLTVFTALSAGADPVQNGGKNILESGPSQNDATSPVIMELPTVNYLPIIAVIDYGIFIGPDAEVSGKPFVVRPVVDGYRSELLKPPAPTVLKSFVRPPLRYWC